MRVITGKFKGKRLFSPSGQSVRPTTDRIKETIFNILQGKIDLNNAAVLDLFCGSGALGIESLSRGAGEAVFVDKSADSVALTKKNLEYCGADFSSYRVYNTDYKVALKKLSQKFDVIFLDPPYGKEDDDLLQTVKKHDVLAKGGIIVYEHDSKNTLKIDVSGFIMDLRDFSGTSTAFLTMDENE